VLHLFYYEELSTKEIAELLKLRQSAVTTRLSRGRAFLKQRLIVPQPPVLSAAAPVMVILYHTYMHLTSIKMH